MSSRKPNILITGTPGVGKTVISHRVARQLGFKHINISKLALEKKLIVERDEERDCDVIDERKVRKVLKKRLESKGGFVIEYHSCGFLPGDLFDAVFVLRAGTSELHTRLTQRGYKHTKITENIECEIFQVSLDEAYETFSREKVVELENNNKKQLKTNIKTILDTVEKLNPKSDKTEEEKH